MNPWIAVIWWIMLIATIAVATQLLAGAESIERSTATIGTALGAPPQSNGRVD